MMGNEDINLSINGIAPYQSFHGLNELKIVSEFIYIFAVILPYCTVLCFMLYKNTAQTEGKFLSYNCKTGNVVWDKVLVGKEQTRE